MPPPPKKKSYLHSFTLWIRVLNTGIYAYQKVLGVQKEWEFCEQVQCVICEAFQCSSSTLLPNNLTKSEKGFFFIVFSLGAGGGAFQMI